MTKYRFCYIVIPANELRKLEKPEPGRLLRGSFRFKEIFMASNRNTFMNYKTQIKHLRNNNLIIEDDNLASHILSKIGYYGLINGYKEVFKNSATNCYISNTTFDDIYQMYLFDADLREVLLKYILIVEKNIKSSIAYHFSDLYENSMNDHQNSSNYDYGKRRNQIHILLKKMH